MTTQQIKERIYSIDFLRGLVMMIMLLDHTRDFVHHGALSADPTDPGTTTVPLFFTRWITHYCAPTFVFLSGVSIYLQKMYGKTNSELARFLFTRGLWLVILEFTVVRFGVTFNVDYGSFFGMAQVIWVIGVSMIVMAALIYLPVRLTGALGLLMIVGHNLLDTFRLPPNVAFGGDPTWGQTIWMVLHQMGLVTIWAHGPVGFVAYPLIPWVGVMALGWAMGSIYEWEAERRRKFLLVLGAVSIVLFIAIRFTNFYGDPNPWTTEAAAAAKAASPSELPIPVPAQAFEPKVSEPTFSILSFLNTTKYPPSLLFLLMTLGPGLVILALMDRIDGKAIWQRIAIVYGRVPMFYYILQWFTAHIIAIVFCLLAGKEIAYLLVDPGSSGAIAPPDYGFSLGITYVAWILGLVILYPLCLWWGNLKRRNKHWLLSYL